MGKILGSHKKLTRMVHVKRREKQVIYSYLLNEGACSVREDFCGKHEGTKVDNIKVMVTVTSLTSRGYLNRLFCWRHNYYTVTEAGVTWLKSQLNLSETKIVPKTHQPKKREEAPQIEGSRSRFGGGRGRGEGRGGFRPRGGFESRGGRREERQQN